MIIETWPVPGTGLGAGLCVPIATGIRVYDVDKDVCVSIDLSRSQVENRNMALALFRALTAPPERWRTYVRDGVCMDLPCIPHNSTTNPDPDGSHSRMLRNGWTCAAVSPDPRVQFVRRPLISRNYL